MTRPSNDRSLQRATDRILDRIDQLQNGLDVLANISWTPPATTQSQIERQPTTISQSSLGIHETDLATLEASRDFLQIPPHRTSSDSVLCWNIFDGRYEFNALIGVLFPLNISNVGANTLEQSDDVFNPPGRFQPPQEERIPALVDNFLQHVHTKNPVLNVERLVKEGRKAAREGLGWDAWSCLVLLACALGSVAKPFSLVDSPSPILRTGGSDFETMIPHQRSSKFVFIKELEEGETYFLLGSRRLGTLKHTLLGAQCHFLAGGKSSLVLNVLALTTPVYLMYTLRPLLSWQYFYHASILFQLHLKTTHGIGLGMLDIPAAHLDYMDRKQRRLEQSLYWSCFKSECEFRVELPLPQSEIGIQHPNLFPSPPSPGTPEMGNHNLASRTSDFPSFPEQEPMRPQTSGVLDDAQVDEERLLKRHSKHLCREEESWYYYLTEIALRRIGNRIINTFFRQEPTSWLNVRPLLRIAQEFDVQVSSWSANLPPAMKHYEASLVIRAPMLDAQIKNPKSSVSRELSWATENRILEMRSWLYQPFLYYFIHSDSMSFRGTVDDLYGTDTSPSRGNLDSLLNPMTEMPSGPIASNVLPSMSISADNLSDEENATLHHMITSGIDCNLKILDSRSLQHRHHGLWYDLRSLMCACTILLGIVKSGRASWIPGGLDLLWGRSQIHDPGSSLPIGGKIGHVLTQFEFWSAESPELARHRDVLAELTRQVQQQLQHRG